MSLLMSMLPFYLLGNFHCIGMCGPLVMMIGHHRYRYFYFLGRTLSFSLSGALAGGIGEVIGALLGEYHISAAVSLFFGLLIFLIGVFSLVNWNFPIHSRVAKQLAKVSKSLSLLILRDGAWPTFVFGLFTVALPCGQTIIVFSACALSGDWLIGLLNGFVFAILTSPSLILAMHAKGFFKILKKRYHVVMGCAAMLIGAIAFCRGLAEFDLIDHWIIASHLSVF